MRADLTLPVSTQPILSGGRWREEPRFDRYAPGGISTLEIENHALVHRLGFILGGGLAPDDIEQVKVYLDAVEIMNVPGQYIADVMNVYDGDNAATKVMFLNFQGMNLSGLGEDFATSINMGVPSTKTGAVVNKIRVDFRIASGAPAGGSIAAYSFVAPQIAPKKMGDTVVGGPGLIPRIFQRKMTAPVGGRNDISDFIDNTADPKKQFVSKIVFDCHWSNIEKIIVRNGEQNADVIRPEIHLIEQAEAGKFYVPGRFILDKQRRYRAGQYSSAAFDRFVAEVYLKAGTDDQGGALAVPSSLTYTTHYVGALQ